MLRSSGKSTGESSMSNLLDIIKDLTINTRDNSEPFYSSKDFIEIRNSENTLDELLELLQSEDDYCWSNRGKICYLVGQMIRQEVVGWWKAVDLLLDILDPYEESPNDNIRDDNFRRYYFGDGFKDSFELSDMQQEFAASDDYFSRAMAALALGKVLSIKSVPLSDDSAAKLSKATPTKNDDGSVSFKSFPIKYVIDLSKTKQDITEQLVNTISCENNLGAGIIPSCRSRGATTSISLRICCANALQNLKIHGHNKTFAGVLLEMLDSLGDVKFLPSFESKAYDPEKMNAIITAMKILGDIKEVKASESLIEIIQQEYQPNWFRGMAATALGKIFDSMA
jgi:hypothetical protein